MPSTDLKQVVGVGSLHKEKYEMSYTPQVHVPQEVKERHHQELELQTLQGNPVGTEGEGG